MDSTDSLEQDKKKEEEEGKKMSEEAKMDVSRRRKR